MASQSRGRTRRVIDVLLRELAELRELDRSGHAAATGSSARFVADDEVERRNRRLMDRFRDLARRGSED